MSSDNEFFCGTVVWFNIGKLNYGFIKPDEGSKDLFVHYSDIVSQGFKALKAGQRVEYRIGQNNAGRPKAIEVTVLA